MMPKAWATGGRRVIKLTWPGGQVVEINGKDVLRIRRAFADYDGPKGNSRVDWLQSDLFEEAAPDIAASVKQELASLASLSMPGGSPVWFNGLEASGPYYVHPASRGEQVGSSLKIGDKIQYVKNTPEEVAAVIKDAGGKVLPIRLDTEAGPTIQGMETPGRVPEEWDPGLFTIKLPPTS